jgi:peptidoglycan/LPS O-acetylase OafA/YrhL
VKERLIGLDGLRGFALLLVLWFHFRGGEMPGGWVGICVFFPLSGFLITRLLVRELGSTERVDLKAFWSRRARRLMPALIAMLAVMPAIAWASGFSAGSVFGAVGSTLAYANNWWQLSQSTDYWAQFHGEVQPFEHLWSLSVEEQFYVVWPIIVFGVWKVARRPHRALLGLCVVVGVGGVAMGLLRSEADSTFVYYNTIVRSAEILVGAAIAVIVSAKPHLLPRARGARVADIAGWVGLGIVLTTAVVLDDSPTFIDRGGMFLVSLAGCASIIGCLTGGSLARALEWPVVRWLGTRSYGLYLWHWPIFVVVTEESVGLSGWWLTAVHASLTVACAVLSHWLVEERWRAKRRPISEPSPVPAPLELAISA